MDIRKFFGGAPAAKPAAAAAGAATTSAEKSGASPPPATAGAKPKAKAAAAPPAAPDAPKRKRESKVTEDEPAKTASPRKPKAAAAAPASAPAAAPTPAPATAAAAAQSTPTKSARVTRAQASPAKRQQKQQQDDDSDVVEVLEDTPVKQRTPRKEKPPVIAPPPIASLPKAAPAPAPAPVPAKADPAPAAAAAAAAAPAPAPAPVPAKAVPAPAPAAAPAATPAPAPAATPAPKAATTRVLPPSFSRPPAAVAGTAPARKSIFTDATFVLTGVLDSMSRDEAMELITKLGGRVTSAVSGKTSFLVTGSVLEDGRPFDQGSKYRTALEKGTKIWNEAEFLDAVKAAGGQTAPSVAPLPGVPPPTVPVAAAAATANGPTMLWADAHKPKSLADLIGNGPVIRKLSEWLKSWESIHLHNGPKPPYTRENPGARAVLLSGPPGVGKTTAATLIAHHFGYEVMELNASDTRSKKTVDALLPTAVSSGVLGGFGAPAKKRLIIMDEIDGMSTSDRGGLAELTKIIKTSKVPIICICNDRQKQAVNNFAKGCYDLPFIPPSTPIIVARLSQIVQAEGINIDREALEALVNCVGGDIRQVFNALQMWCKSTSQITAQSVKDRLKQISKDELLRVTGTDAAMFMFHRATTTPLESRYEMFFTDYDLVPLVVQQAYPTAFQNFESGDKLAQMRRLAAAANAIADGELMLMPIRAKAQWELLPAAAALHVKATYHAAGNATRVFFPEWFGKNSTQTKHRRQLSELCGHTRATLDATSTTMRLLYAPVLRRHFFMPLIRDKTEGVTPVIDSMDAYGFTRSDVMENLVEVALGDDAEFLTKVETQTKSAFTRKYNSMAHKNQAVAEALGDEGALIVGAKAKRSKAAKAKARMDAEMEGDEQDDASSAGDESDLEIETPAKKPRAAAGAKGGAGGAAAGAKGRGGGAAGAKGRGGGGGGGGSSGAVAGAKATGAKAAGRGRGK